MTIVQLALENRLGPKKNRRGLADLMAFDLDLCDGGDCQNKKQDETRHGSPLKQLAQSYGAGYLLPYWNTARYSTACEKQVLCEFLAV